MHASEGHRQQQHLADCTVRVIIGVAVICSSAPTFDMLLTVPSAQCLLGQ